MYEPSGRQFPFVAFLWPAMAAASASEFAATLAKQFVDLAVGSDQGESHDGEPAWTTDNRVALRLKTVSLRDFSTARDGVPTLLVTPFALHGSTIIDIAPGYSLIAALREAGLTRLFATNWHSATPDMRYLGIDDYLAELNVLVDTLGGRVNLVGLCQGGWMALLYAARFPAKIAKLVLAGAPVDIAAGDSGLSALAASSPLEVFHELVSIGDGRVLGRAMLQFWGSASITTEEIGELLQVPDPVGSPAQTQIERLFRRWYAWTVDLPGQFYLEVIEKLYKRNELPAGSFVALGEKVDLRKVRTPIFLLAARDDEVVAPAQLFATRRLVGTPHDDIEADVVDCRHIGLFMGRTALLGPWPKIARWIAAPDAVAPPLDGTDAGDAAPSRAIKSPARTPV